MGQKEAPLSPRSPRLLSPRMRSPRKGVRQRAAALLLPLMGLIGMTVILSGSNLLNQTRVSIDRLANDPHSAIRLAVAESGCKGEGDSGGGCRQAQYDASLIQDGDTEVRLRELGVRDEQNGSRREVWEQFRQLSEEEKRMPFENAGLLMDGDAYVFALRLQSEELGATGNGTSTEEKDGTALSETGITVCTPPGVIEGSGNGTGNSSAGVTASCSVTVTVSSPTFEESSAVADGTSSPLTAKRISRLSRWYRWNETAPEVTVNLYGRALSGSVNASGAAAETEEQEDGSPGALPLWSLGIAELEKGGENGTWLELATPSGDAWIRIYRAWLTRDRFLGLFSLLFLALHSNGTAAALVPPSFLCQVGRNTARMTATSPAGGNSSLLLLHCPLAPTFSDQLKQARPDSRGDAQWRPNTVLLEPATLLPVTLSLLDSVETDGSVNGLPTSSDGNVARSSFTLKPLASLVRQPRFQLAACVGPINATVSRAEWVESVEYHVGVIGVEHLFVYMPAGERNVLQDYEREKLVTVVPWEASEVPSGNGSSARDWRSLARNQCLWHTRGLAHWTLFLDGPTAHVQIGAQYGHSFGNWSAALSDDVAIVELPTFWNTMPLNSSALPGNHSLLFQQCTWPLSAAPAGAAEARMLIAAGSKVRYIGLSPDLDQVTPGEQLQHREAPGEEIAVQACDREMRRLRTGAVNESAALDSRVLGLKGGERVPRSKRREDSGVVRISPGELSKEVVRRLERRVEQRMLAVLESEDSAGPLELQLESRETRALR
ncbi:hypothetical protein KFL_006470070 [Klebsormidium nitens]|uniref:Uncharacterized protein n=1 Tax=Klebsormidium nitens TaxID=105231 RepID=A0A1Y1IHY6_KLENI|nr:hypothetical protein KFL_006470070 [Klebsormidium nitens]|eukprot:GAQ90495.1 hypothetical protein KFL_006470070 [Klebsormidium nitens]